MDIKTTPPPPSAMSSSSSTTYNNNNTSSTTAITPPVASTAPPSPIAAAIVGLSDVQKQTFQHIFEKLVSNSSAGKFAPKQMEQFRHLLENVRDTKNLQLIVEKFKNLEQFEQNYLSPGNNNSISAEGKKNASKRRQCGNKKSKQLENYFERS